MICFVVAAIMRTNKLMIDETVGGREGGIGCRGCLPQGHAAATELEQYQVLLIQVQQMRQENVQYRQQQQHWLGSFVFELCEGLWISAIRFAQVWWHRTVPVAFARNAPAVQQNRRDSGQEEAAANEGVLGDTALSKTPRTILELWHEHEFGKVADEKQEPSFLLKIKKRN